MGIKNRILRRAPGPETPVPDDATTEFPVAPAEPAPQGDPLTGATAVPEAGAEPARQLDLAIRDALRRKPERHGFMRLRHQLRAVTSSRCNVFAL